MTVVENQEKTSPVFIFNSSSTNGSGVYLLFVDKRPPSKHDLLVTDYSGAFKSLELAMDWYDKRYLPYGEPQALIARFDGDRLNVIARSVVLGEEDYIAEHPAWVYAFDMDGDDD